MTHKGRAIEYGSYTDAYGTTHYFIEISGVTVWRRSVTGPTGREAAEAAMKHELSHIQEETNT